MYTRKDPHSAQKVVLRPGQPAPKVHRPPPPPPQYRPAPLPPQGRRRSKQGRALLFALLPAVIAAALLVVVLAGAALAVYSRGILPGVRAAGLHVGGRSVEEATRILDTAWIEITLADGGRTWSASPALLGLTLDAPATARRAYQQGRGDGSPLQALLGPLNVGPVLSIDYDMLQAALSDLMQQFYTAPVNAGVTLVDGQVQATPPQYGRMLDVNGTVARLRANPALLDDGTLELVMMDVAPDVMDAGPIVAQAQRLLSSHLDLRLYDPVTGDSVYWSAPPQLWGTWLSATADETKPGGLALSADAAQVRAWLAAQSSATLDASRRVDLDAAAQSVQAAIAAGDPSAAWTRVLHNQRQHTVRPGETITSIAWDYGIPYPYIQQANGGVEYLFTGQTITIPAADSFLLLPVVPHKRIVVSISQQRTWVYENEQLIWDWPTSTGIADSPTWPGIYQIISHEPNAYAGNWDLWMPNFMGVYRPIPGSEFTNGFHGFPTRGGGQLLWENSLGRRVTYGCILLSNTNIRLLYDWAEAGVVVEIRR